MNLRATIQSSAIAFFFFTVGTSPAEMGLFEQESDIGKVSHAGSTRFDPATQTYLISGGGENMWFTNDAFHFVWTHASGDFSLQAAIEWLGAGGNPHRKACLLARQSLAPEPRHAGKLRSAAAVGNLASQIDGRII